MAMSQVTARSQRRPDAAFDHAMTGTGILDRTQGDAQIVVVAKGSMPDRAARDVETGAPDLAARRRG